MIVGMRRGEEGGRRGETGKGTKRRETRSNIAPRPRAKDRGSERVG